MFLSDWLNYWYTSANSMHRLEVFIMVTVYYFFDFSLDNSIPVKKHSRKNFVRFHNHYYERTSMIKFDRIYFITC